MEKLSRDELIAIVERYLRADVAEDEDDALITALVVSTGNPNVTDLLFYPEPGDEDLTAAQIVDKALAYQPFAL